MPRNHHAKKKTQHLFMLPCRAKKRLSQPEPGHSQDRTNQHMNIPSALGNQSGSLAEHIIRLASEQSAGHEEI